MVFNILCFTLLYINFFKFEGMAYAENFLKKTFYELAFFGIIFLVLLIALVFALKSGGSPQAATPARRRVRPAKND